MYFKGLYIQDIEHQRVCLHTHKQNEIAEKEKSLYLTKKFIHCLLKSNVPNHFGVKAAHTAVHLINHLLSQTIGNISPFECVFGVSHDYFFLQCLQSTNFFHLQKQTEF